MSFLVVLNESWESGCKGRENSVVRCRMRAVDVTVNGLAGELIHFPLRRREAVVLTVGETVQAIL